MRVQDVERFWQRVDYESDQPDPLIQIHYLAVLVAIANGQADPDPAALAQAVLRGVAGKCQTPEVRYVQSSDQAVSGDEIH